MTITENDAAHGLLQAAANDEQVPLPAVVALFDSLPAVEPGTMIGEWRGTIVRTGHPGEGRLGALGWVGKTFRAAGDVDPIVSLDAAGRRVANPVLGAASLLTAEYRGVSTATMAYDDHPVRDHFRAIDADTVLGLMDAEGDRAAMAFLLHRLVDGAGAEG